jgi:hypothetical protein
LRGFDEKGRTGWERATPLRIFRLFGEDPSRGPFLMKVFRTGPGSEPEEEHPHAKDQPSGEVADQKCWLDVVPNRVKVPDRWSSVVLRAFDTQAPMAATSVM